MLGRRPATTSAVRPDSVALQFDAPASSSSPGGAGLASGVCLEELSLEVLRKLCEAGKGGKLGSDRKGLLLAIRPYLEDLIARKQGLRSVVERIAEAADVDGMLPRVLTELTPKDLAVAFFLGIPGGRRTRLAAAFAGLRSPLPLCYRALGAEGEPKTVTDFKLLHELACVPQAGRQLLVSIGTERVLGCGKTSLLAALSLTPVAKEDLDIRPAGPTHMNSCDLLCAEQDRWLADIHGNWSALDEELRLAVMALSLWGGATCLVHCGAQDFLNKSNAPGKELGSLLASIAQAGAQLGAKGLVRCRGILVLIRDMSAEAFAPRKSSIEAQLKPFGVLDCIAVEDWRTFRSATRAATAAERLRSRLDESLAKPASNAGTPLTGLDGLLFVHRTLVDGTGLHPGDAAQAPAVFPRSLCDELAAILDQARGTGFPCSVLFPLSALNRRMTVLRRADGSGSSTSTVTVAIARGASRPSSEHANANISRFEQLRLEEEQALAREAEASALEKEMASVPCSRAMRFFREKIAAAPADSRPAVVTEVALFVETWKEPHTFPLLKRQRELFDQLAGSGERAGQEDGNVKAEFDKVSANVAELDFSIDSFWSELELLSEQQNKQAVKGSTPVTPRCSVEECRTYESLIREGQPFQVLHGRPLQMAGGFLRGILDSIGASCADPRGIFVVSVIGAQSSAKSTLLNFLFGCGFAVRAGRCTRGLYASYFHPAGGPPMLVLDSEGLLSLGSEGGVFDGQIALMCMTCSHLVLVNHKGELSRQLQDLLEVCLFAMRHLRLSRLQPRLAFVLRDQHDRSRTVHEDMLKQMRSHLEEAARTLGIPLHDLILLDGTAVFLLPSAVTSELRNGQEVCWTSELFARDVLTLRGEVFRWLQEDAKTRAAKQDGMPPAFTSLAQWYDHAATCWETLVQFGEQLLHYRTIHEIELRRELADVAKAAVRDALDGVAPGSGGDNEGATTGFHARARQMVESFVAQIHVGPSRLDLETTDMEFSRALACLRDECVAQLEEVFQDRASSPRFSAAAKEQTKQQIRTPIEWAFENHLYTWKLHLKKASDEKAMHQLWVHFTGVLNRHLANSGHRSCLSPDESRSLFDGEWRDYEKSYLNRLRSLTKGWQNLAHEVTLLFNHAASKLQHESGPLALLKEVGPQQVALPPEKRREAGQPCIGEQTDEEWEEHYFHVGWWASMKAKGLALLDLPRDSVATSSSAPSHSVVGRLRQVVEQGLQQVRMEVRTRGALDEATAAEGLRHMTLTVLQDIEARLLADCSVTLKRPQMLHALQIALRIACIEALVFVEEDKQQKAMSDLLAQKALIEEHFLLIVQANKGDVERATNFATLYHRQLMSWMDQEVTQLAADVRGQVLQEMPDPQKSSERAFQRSFAAHSWPDVLEYVIDMNAYLEKLFLMVFHQRKNTFVATARGKLERRILATYRLLQDVAGMWARREAAADVDSGVRSRSVDVVKGPSAQVLRSVRELKDFIVTHTERVPKSADSAEAHKQLAERLPATADFTIADPRLFAETLQARIGDYAASLEIPQRLAQQLDRALREQSVQAWSLIRGCSERCPLCGSKCDHVGEHSRHHCAHHLFPAFHGWMDRNTGLPSFNHCLGAATREGTYECKDGAWKKFEEYLREDHPAWMPFITDQAAGDRDVQHLRAAWVNCREALLEYFSPMADVCPEEWHKEFYEEGKALTKKDLEVAKDTIRKLRSRTWVPPDD